MYRCVFRPQFLIRFPVCVTDSVQMHRDDPFQRIGTESQGQFGTCRRFAGARCARIVPPRSGRTCLGRGSAGLVELTARFAEWGKGLADDPGFKAFVAYVQANAPRIWNWSRPSGRRSWHWLRRRRRWDRS